MYALTVKCALFSLSHFLHFRVLPHEAHTTHDNKLCEEKKIKNRFPLHKKKLVLVHRPNIDKKMLLVAK
jgi:hypothetical protein